VVVGPLDTPDPYLVRMAVVWVGDRIVSSPSLGEGSHYVLWTRRKVEGGSGRRTTGNMSSIKDESIRVAWSEVHEVDWMLGRALGHLDGRMNGWYDDELMSSPFISSSFYLFSFL